ncbi:MAG TPA: transcription antitermination factor NusB [Solirubrobacteraceae bacterium]
MSAAAVSPARRCAHAVVRRTLAEDAYADRAFHGEAQGLDPRDRALAKRIAFGAVQRRGTLDWVADRYTRGALEPKVRAALHVGLYQLLFMDGVAAHAAVGEAVELAKPSRGHSVVNAVLRRVQREGVELPADDTPEGAAIRHAHPLWIVRLWWDWLGPEQTRALLISGNEPAELALRVNPLAPGVALDDIPGEREGETIVVSGPFDAFAHPGYAAGAFTPQSRAAQRVGRFLAPEPGERILDLCAAPGGKTTHLAALMGGTGEIVAVERHEGRAAALERTCARMHAANVQVRCADALEFRDADRFDRVLLDPPCSGLGTLQSHPDLRWRVTPQDVAELAGIQRAMLEAARANLRPGGRLVYAVCTLSPEEEALEGIERWRTLPSVDGTDGFYSAADVGG